MIKAKIPDNEEVRLRHLVELGILDTLEEQAYDDLAGLAARICKTPIGLVSLVDKDRQWFKAHCGLDAHETPRDVAFCSHAILGDEVFVVEDSSKDERFYDNPLVTGEPHVKFYAGAPLIMSNNIKVGTLCIIDHKARSISNNDKDALRALARQVVSQFELRLKVKELESLDKTKDEFISMVSHELRTPLTSIYGSLSLLINNKAELLGDKKQELMDVSFRNSERLLYLVNDILDLAKLESGRVDFKNKNINVLELLEKSVELNLPFSKICNVELVISCPIVDKPIIVYADEQRLLQVMSNFISNAAKFSCENDKIIISARVNNKHVIIEVIDHGAGIPSELQDLIFEKFRQLHPNINNKMPGTGLGLNISKNIIERQQGIIGFESERNVKTTFYFKLPIVK